MADLKQDNTENKKAEVTNEVKEGTVEQATEQFEPSTNEQISKEEKQALREKIEATDIDDSLKMQALSQAQDLSSMKEGEKIKELLKMAHEKGIVYAVAVAKKTDDSYLLDTLHDTLVKEGFYKQIP